MGNWKRNLHDNKGHSRLPKMRLPRRLPFCCDIRSKSSKDKITKQLNSSRGSSSSSLIKILECPVCLNALNPPIHQCANGHTLCSSCQSTVHNRCPICRSSLGNIRCLALEKLAETLTVPCMYKDNGCNRVFTYPYSNKVRHEGQCPRMPFKCPFVAPNSDCLITGDIRTLLAHLKHDHLIHIQEGCIFNYEYLVPRKADTENGTWLISIFKCYGQYFCLQFEALKIGATPVYVTYLRFLGDEKEANDFCYSIEIDCLRQKLMFQGIPRSIRENHSKSIEDFDALMIQQNLAMNFSSANTQQLNLRVCCKIWRKQDKLEITVS